MWGTKKVSSGTWIRAGHCWLSIRPYLALCDYSLGEVDRFAQSITSERIVKPGLFQCNNIVHRIITIIRSACSNVYRLSANRIIDVSFKGSFIFACVALCALFLHNAHIRNDRRWFALSLNSIYIFITNMRAETIDEWGKASIGWHPAPIICSCSGNSFFSNWWIR